MQRALSAIISHDWAMQPEYLRTMLEIAAREHPGLKAVEAERGERLEYTYSVTVRSGVAIIPITGPIFRYANLFAMISGGTSVSLLSRDFNVALNSPLVDSILFEVNSPGGEVTGINELAAMIYEARGKKPMIARAGGLCASAAYWLASACGEIVCDETAQLGSIGVYCAYLDAKKADQKAGYREIVIKSSQSPKKALDPSTPEGERAIQVRIDALAQVFIESVARHRDVDVEAVLSDFGQGDVMVGQAAIDAGIADRLGSFEETLAELARAHGPTVGRPYTGALDGSGVAADVKSDVGAGSEPGVEGKAGESDEETDEDPEKVPEAPEDEGPAKDPDDDYEEDEEARLPLNPMSAGKSPVTMKGAMEMADEKTTDVAAEGNQPTLADLQKQLAEANARADQNEKVVARLTADARTARLREIAKGFTGEEASHMTVLEHLATTAGEDSSVFKSHVQTQNALAEQVRQSDLFKEVGKSGAENAESAYGKLSAAATKIAAENKLTFEQAFEKAVEANPELYKAYMTEEAQARS